VPQRTTEEIFTLPSEKGRDSTVQIRTVEANSGNLTGVGSGFFVAHDKIATNLHNVIGNDLVFAKLTDAKIGWEIEGVTAFDFKNDLVVLKIEGKGEPLLLADSDSVQIGESVTTLGFPERKYKITEGTVYGIEDNRFRVKAEYVGGMSVVLC
jgi:S1-C subfamily serine protease